MSDRIELRIVYERDAFRQALRAWWSSVVPPVPFLHRAISWAVFWMAVAVLAGVLAAFDVSPWYVLAGLIGAAVPVAVFAFLQRTRIGRFHEIIGRHWERAGVGSAVFDAEGVTLTDAVSRREITWNGIDAIAAARGVTVLRTGYAVIAIPDAALDGMSPETFRDRLHAWSAP